MKASHQITVAIFLCSALNFGLGFYSGYNQNQENIETRAKKELEQVKTVEEQQRIERIIFSEIQL